MTPDIFHAMRQIRTAHGSTSAAASWEVGLRHHVKLPILPLSKSVELSTSFEMTKKSTDFQMFFCFWLRKLV